jgi:O-acetylserine/cysteine efflux transporter
MTAIGYGIWYRVLSKHSITQVMPVLLLTPVFTIMTSIGFLGEQPSVAVLTGGVIVIGGVAMIVLSRASPTSSTSGT